MPSDPFVPFGMDSRDRQIEDSESIVSLFSLLFISHLGCALLYALSFSSLQLREECELHPAALHTTSHTNGHLIIPPLIDPLSRASDRSKHSRPILNLFFFLFFSSCLGFFLTISLSSLHLESISTVTSPSFIVRSPTDCTVSPSSNEFSRPTYHGLDKITPEK